MSHHEEASNEANFKWGIKRGVGGRNKDTHFYKSFTYCGVEYLLYDCVHFYNIHASETFIGKLIKAFESPSHGKLVQVVWFFRPSEIRNFLGDYEPRWNELFLASGEGIGVSNLTPLESIVGKCSIICTSKDKRNAQASERELSAADFIFSRAFDVGQRRILKKFADKIDGIQVEHFFNQPRDKVNVPAVNHAKSGCTIPVVKEYKEATRGVGDAAQHGGVSLSGVVDKYKRARFLQDTLPPSASDIHPYKKRWLEEDKFSGFQSPHLAQETRIRKANKSMEDTRQQHDNRSWFKPLPWEDLLKEAEEAGTLVLLDNLDPSFTSSEVEDLVWQAFCQRVQAKMIPRSTFSSPHHGQALVIFKSKVAAEHAVKDISTKCLMLAEGRVIVGREVTLKNPSRPAAFSGHLVIDKLKHVKQHGGMRKAISTSHCAQRNTVEFDMAMEWCELYEKAQLCWDQLHKEQAERMEKVRSQLSMNYKQ